MQQWTNQSRIFEVGTITCKAFSKPPGGIWTISTAFLEILSNLNFLSLPVDKINSESLHSLAQSCEINSRPGRPVTDAVVCGWISVSEEQEV